MDEHIDVLESLAGENAESKQIREMSLNLFKDYINGKISCNKLYLENAHLMRQNLIDFSPQSTPPQLTFDAFQYWKNAPSWSRKIKVWRDMLKKQKEQIIGWLRVTRQRELDNWTHCQDLLELKEIFVSANDPVAIADINEMLSRYSIIPKIPQISDMEWDV